MFESIKNLFSKKKDDSNTPSSDASDKGSTSVVVSSWSSDRYSSILIQRNILILLTFLSLVGISVASVMIAKVATSKTFEPFVIQIEERTGQAKIVKKAESDLISSSESLTKYFIKRYLNAREAYNPVDFEYNSNKVVRLLSSQEVYNAYLGFIRATANDPTIKYGRRNTTYIKLKSFTKLRNQYFVRFTVNETADGEASFSKIATIETGYAPMELNEEDRDINPVGFQIIGYKVDDDTSN